jgi:molybdopterin-guanine dinucleotide biosynthesis protein A
MRPPLRMTDAAGFVLAGGRSSRMGTDKALVEFRGQPMIVHALEILRGAGLDVSIAGARADLEAYAPVVPDAAPDQGPLAGICSAMAATHARWSVYLPVDLPLLPSSLIRFLLDRARTRGQVITITSVTGFMQTFPAVLDRSALPWLKSELAGGRGGCFAAFQAVAAALKQPLDEVPAELLEQSGQVTHPGGLAAESWFFNINSADDLRRAETQLQGLIG